MRNPRDIIIKPVITEESMDNMAYDKYTFVVDKRATKPEIKSAIEEIFEVEVKKINTMNVPGKLKRMGMNQGMTKNWKKAIVTLTEESDSIEFFEGM